MADFVTPVSAATSAFDIAKLRPCPLCESYSSAPVFQTICRCKHCGFHFVSPLGNYRGENETEEYFLNEYLPLHESNRENSLAERRAHLSMIQGYSPLPDCPRILDVGCALGFMLQEATAAGWDAVGVETSAFAAGYALEHTGCPVYAGPLQQANFDTDSFDVVTLMDVIEHVPDPRSLIREAYRVLRPGGVIFLITPNFGSLFVRLFRENAYGIGPEEHVSYFQPRTMKSLLATCGFRNVVTGTKDFYAANIARLMGKSHEQTQPEIKSAFRPASSLGKLRRVANKIFMHVHIGDKLIALAQK
jgi:2-polyprenyl-3-methyl-5-hydroxy-6-metoxy-1,4-benzoquinol methylase